jgi:hypothetical protein
VISSVKKSEYFTQFYAKWSERPPPEEKAYSRPEKHYPWERESFQTHNPDVSNSRGKLSNKCAKMGLRGAGTLDFPARRVPCSRSREEKPSERMASPLSDFPDATRATK